MQIKKRNIFLEEVSSKNVSFGSILLVTMSYKFVNKTDDISDYDAQHFLLSCSINMSHVLSHE